MSRPETLPPGPLCTEKVAAVNRQAVPEQFFQPERDFFCKELCLIEPAFAKALFMKRDRNQNLSLPGSNQFRFFQGDLKAEKLRIIPFVMKL